MKEKEYKNLLNHLIAQLIEEHEERENQQIHFPSHLPESQKRLLLQQLLTIRPPLPQLLDELDRLFEYETEKKKDYYISIEDLEPISRNKELTSKIYLYKGDITLLSTDYIVNAANERLLGCFQPQHKCIDNAIHSAAGPRLREACYHLVQSLPNQMDSVGQARITPAFHLPSKYIIHTIGPQVDANTTSSSLPVNELESCYRNCLEAVYKENNSRLVSIAFCCISTGIFGFPSKEASQLAINTVIEWLEKHPNFPIKVVFNVFTEKDELLYQSYLQSKFHINIP